MEMVEPKNDSEIEQAESAKERYKKLLKLLENEIWPQIPSSQLGIRLSKAEEEEILGFEE
jgi:antitoxin VapB